MLQNKLLSSADQKTYIHNTLKNMIEIYEGDYDLLRTFVKNEKPSFISEEMWIQEAVKFIIENLTKYNR